MKVLETERLVLRWLSTEDSGFILHLVNDPSWLQFIGDKGVHTLEDARSYILNGPVEMYSRLGFGLYLTELKLSGEPIGICGLVKRDSLQDVDIGFAFLPGFWGNGYAIEAASAVLAHGKSVLGLKRIVAITSPDNHSSIRLLEKMGMGYEKMVTLSDNAPESSLFARNF